MFIIIASVVLAGDAVRPLVTAVHDVEPGAFHVTGRMRENLTLMFAGDGGAATPEVHCSRCHNEWLAVEPLAHVK